MQQPSNQMPRDKTQLTDYQKEILALEPKREDYPLASDEAWEEMLEAEVKPPRPGWTSSFVL